MDVRRSFFRSPLCKLFQGRRKRQTAGGPAPAPGTGGAPAGAGAGGGGQNQLPPVNEDFELDAKFAVQYMSLSDEIRKRIGHRQNY